MLVKKKTVQKQWFSYFLNTLFTNINILNKIYKILNKKFNIVILYCGISLVTWWIVENNKQFK